MARGRKKETLTPEERLQAALVPESEQPYTVPRNWCWTQLGTYILYFSDKPIPPSETDWEGYQKVQAFKQKYNGIYFSYCTAEDFESSFYAHLTQYFLSVKAVADAKLQRKSQLVLRGIDVNGHLCETPTVFDFKFNTSKDSKTQLSQIKELYRKIDSMHMGQRLPVEEDEIDQSPLNALAYMGSSLFPPVTIDQKIQEAIVAVAKVLEISLSKMNTQ